MTKAEVKNQVLANGGNAYVAEVIVSEEFAKFFNANIADGLSNEEALTDAFISCQKRTLAMVQHPEVIKYVAERTYTEIRSKFSIN